MFQNSAVRRVVVHHQHLQRLPAGRARGRPESFWTASRLPELRREVKRASSSRFALQPDSPSHHVHQAAGNRQTQARSAVLPAGRAIRLRKGFENQFLLFLGHPDARVAHRKMQLHLVFFFPLQLRLQNHFPAVGELDGIAQQIHQHLAQPRRVANHHLRHVGPDVAYQFQPFLARSDCQSFASSLPGSGAARTACAPSPFSPPRSSKNPECR